jgi:hypothetical protein
MSGKNLPGFDDAVHNVGGLEPPITGGRATAKDLAGANTSEAEANAVKLSKITTRIKLINKLRGKGSAGYNDPGICAGAKLVARSHHRPIEMTEMFFVPPNTDSWSGHYRQLRLEDEDLPHLSAMSAEARERVLQNRDSTEEPSREFTSDDSVGSCNSCQALLFMTMCPKRTCS